MRKTLILLTALLGLFWVPAGAQKRDVNYDESKVGSYTLPDPLTFTSGQNVRNAQDWQKRRLEILDIFQREMYGQMPPKSEIYLETLEEGLTLGGYGLRRQVRMWFKPDHTGPRIDWLIITPTHIKESVPAVLMLNYYGNHTILADKEILITDAWLRDDATYKIENHHATEKGRGAYLDPNLRTVYPIGMILARGYAFVTACYGDVSPDPEAGDMGREDIQDTLAYTGVFDLWGRRDASRTDNTTALMAWGWALCRGMDMIERDPALDAGSVILTGSSRLAKAALIAGAFDERFPVVVANQTGGGGVPLAKRNYGENVGTMTTQFTHWYCKAYSKYAHNEASMPFDQHMLLACVAPRALLVEGFNEGWFDTKGEFLSLKAASPVWELLGRGGLPDVDWPADYQRSAIGEHIGYYHRPEKHGISALDWTWMLEFADRQFGVGR